MESESRWLTALIVVNFLIQIFFVFIFIFALVLLPKTEPLPNTQDLILFLSGGALIFAYIIGLIGLWKRRKWGLNLFFLAFAIDFARTVVMSIQNGEFSLSWFLIIPLWLLVLGIRNKNSFN